MNGNNAELQLNTGYNVNQVEYLKDHFDKYRAGPKYNPATQYEQMNQSSYSKTYSSSAQQESVAQVESSSLLSGGGGIDVNSLWRRCQNIIRLSQN